jgi:hypothetical protein
LQHMWKTYATSRQTHLQHTSEKTDETLGTDTYNICVQSLQHMKQPDLLLQHSYETLATYI